MQRQLAVLLVLACACARNGVEREAKSPASTTVVATSDGSASSRRQRLEALEREILAAIDVPRADSLDQCASIAFGAKPCGGPWRYLVYSTKITDAGKLESMVAEHEALEKTINAEEGSMSDCMRVLPPPLALVDGVCRARGVTDSTSR